MKKKIWGMAFISCGIIYFLAMFRYIIFFERLNDIVSYILFIAAVIAIVLGMMLLLFQKPEEHENEQAVKQAETQILKENARCAPIIVYILLGVNVAMFLLVNVFEGENSVLNYAVSKSDPAFYRMIAAMFVHIDIEHLLFNMATLLICGKRLESLIGRLRFSAVYLLSGIASSIALTLFSKQPCVGASGAIFGMIGCFWLIACHNRKIIKYTFWKELLPTAAVNFALTFLLPNISAIAHITGFVLGMVFCALFCRKSEIKGE